MKFKDRLHAERVRSVVHGTLYFGILLGVCFWVLWGFCRSLDLINQIKGVM